MPTISMFYGILISMYFKDTQQHHLPHIHVEYQDFNAILSLPDGDVIESNLPPKKIENGSSVDGDSRRRIDD